MEYTVNMDAPDPVYEAAYSRLVKLIRSNKAFLDGVLAAPPGRLGANFKVAAVRAHKDIVQLRAATRRDAMFREYLGEKLAVHFGAEYTKRLFAVFLDG